MPFRSTSRRCRRIAKEEDMAKASKETAARSATGHGCEGRFDELGDYAVAFDEFRPASSRRLCGS
jgi:hypothetical protein